MIEITGDVFICHASEDKDEIVRPLANTLKKEGISCWLDEAEILWGDSITEKINEGLTKPLFVIVVLSKNFLSKKYPQRELNAILNIEASTGEVKVLPLIVGNKKTKQDIFKKYPLINDKYYLTWDGRVEHIISELKKRLSKFKKNTQTIDEPAHIPTIEYKAAYIPKVKKKFTQLEKDRFLKKSFNTIKSYFKDALSELESRYTQIETDFTEVNNLKFTSKVYVNGEARCQCIIWIGGMGSSNSIGYYEGPLSIGNDNSYNEMISVEDDGFDLYLKFLMGYPLSQSGDRKFSPDEAAELLWKRFTNPLER